MHKYKLYYLASPYSHPDPEMRTKRYEEVSDATVALLKQGIYAFSPITYNHPMERHQLPTSWDFWEPYDIAFLERCDEMIVLMLDGWRESIGVNAEIEFAHRKGIAVSYLNPKYILEPDKRSFTKPGEDVVVNG